ncbi:hypothetical protein STM14_3427 [Salmonella enterica subsp. enterica serovar Typhimurium str. 14028S]|uniref:Uncharacterized protein n=2 Tax=Salmonella enterica I TaxID=59201 RepID=A0A0F6B5P7_SALT1|nr:hypothetical protein SPAB_03527 [Salmonella enterica subsp. enterica serovar Paratyphi B str. SPB7]ACY89841.1 hypothetical protein STM14_3427 [Salmonella enterica subsp. enterica serovar Typhimurium str. 14028S]
MITLTYVFTRHTSRCMCVGFPRSPRSRTDVRSWDSLRRRLPATRII